MTYKKKLTILSSIIAALSLIFILTIIFDPERWNARSAAYSWLEPSQKDRISGIAIANANGTITLARNGGKWFVSNEGKDYPARSMRIDDFIAALSRRAQYPVRSSSASSHERLSLNEDQAVRVTIAAGAGLPLLSLLIGQPDITGQNVYLRRQGQNEVRSGEDIFSSYTNSTVTSWYNLRLFPENEDGRLDAAGVQRLTVYPPADDEGNTPPPQTFTRRGREWTFSFEVANPDMARVDAYIRDILNTSGDDFVSFVAPSDSMFNNSRIALELGDGSMRTIRLGPPDENGKRFAAVSGSDWVYSIPAWASQRFFATPENFEMN
ncbi:MAG: DUF4340 domain-containing protein [Treponema sp.]|jgi:hypothetical protein|nr:DUF4340 domain-containing protein [Treponema sp.]